MFESAISLLHWKLEKNGLEAARVGNTLVLLEIENNGLHSAASKSQNILAPLEFEKDSLGIVRVGNMGW